jgi:hypothetical protein
MEKKELAERIVEYASNYHWNLEGWGDNVPEDDDLEKELTGIVTFVFEELDKAREEVQFTKEELECILKWKDACDGEFNGMTLLPASGEDWGKEEDIESAEDKLEEMLSKLKDNK